MTPISQATNINFRLFSSKSSKINSQSFNSKQSRRLARLILARKTSFSLSSTSQQQKSLSLHNFKVFQTNAKGIHDSIVSQSCHHSANPRRRTFTLKVGSFSRFFPSLSFKTPVFTPNGLISRSKNRSKLFFKSQYHSNRVQPTRALVSVHSNLSRPGKSLRLSSLGLPHSLTASLTDSYNSGLRRARLIRRVRIKSRRVTAYNTLSSTHYDVFSGEPAQLPFSEQPVASQLLRSVQGVSQSNLSLNG